MIKNIRLLNWRSHSDSRLEFREGTNLLVGIMGAGKSSVLEGISFALYGTFPAVERRKMKLENAVRLSEGHATVEMEFLWGSDLYKVERSIERSKRGTSSRAELYRNGSLVEHGPQAVTGHISELTGADYDLFTRAIYSEQNNIDHFLALDPKKRKEEIDSLLGLDRFELARANSVTVLNRLRSKRSGLMERFKKEKIGELESREKSVSESSAALENRLAALSGSLAKKESEVLSLSSRFEEMRKEKEAFERSEKEGIRLSALAEALSKELEGKALDEKRPAELEKALSERSSRRSRLQSELAPHEARLAALSKETGSIEQSIRSMQENAKKASGLREELGTLSEGKPQAALSQEQSDLESGIARMEGELMALKKEAADLSELLPRLQEGLSKCPLCSAPLGPDGAGHVRAEKETSLRNAKERIHSLESAIGPRKKQASALSERMRKISLLSERISSLEKESDPSAFMEKKKALEASVQEIEEARKSMRAELERIAGESESMRLELARLRETNQKHAQLAEAKSRLEAGKRKAAECKFDPELFEKARQGLEALRLEREKARSEISSSKEQLRLARESLSLIRDELGMLRSMEKDIAEISGLEEQLSVYRQALLETQTGLREEMSEAINSAMNEIWSIFYPYRNYHGLRLLVSEKDYVFEVNDGSSWKSLESVASGGERACAALALRMSLAMVLTPKIGWLILDEPTHNLDSEAVEALSHALAFKVPQVVRQTFVITHDESFMGSDFASSLRLTRDKSANGPTKAESQ